MLWNKFRKFNIIRGNSHIARPKQGQGKVFSNIACTYFGFQKTITNTILSKSIDNQKNKRYLQQLQDKKRKLKKVAKTDIIHIYIPEETVFLKV